MFQEYWEENKKRVRAFMAAYKNRDPCDWCKRQHPQWHHATVYGDNICHWCYLAVGGRICTQLYPGDEGLPAFHGSLEIL